MTSERWKRIGVIFDAALEVEPQKRGAFLVDACAGDDELRFEVERMLVEDAEARGSLNRTFTGWAMAGESQGATSLGHQPAEGDITGKLLQGRFLIRARLGEGGMGEVFLADDPKLKRSVALKRLPAKMRSDERYRSAILQEARRASSLNDPHIAQVYDVLEEDGEAFLLMEYIEGITLRQRIKTPLSTVELLDIAIQTTGALLTAHRKGVVHCDIKPENIMLTPAGQVKVLDFGIAERLPVEDEGAAAQTTVTKVRRGTPVYMAPEVLAGNGPDARSDIYSLGITLYEACVGRRPGKFRVPNADASGATDADRPAPPPAIASILKKMLHPDPSQRYPDAGELLRDLRSVQEAKSLESVPPPVTVGRLGPRREFAIGAVLLVATFAWVAVTQVRPWIYRAMHPVPEQKQVAVLPFSVAGADASTKAFADGLSEVLSAKLTQLTERPQFQVIPVSEVRAKHVVTATDARKEFGVNLVIEGTWQQASGSVHVVPVLIDATSNRQLRANEFVAASTDPIGLEAQVTSGVLKMLGIELQPGERQAFTNQGTKAPDAYAYYLRGRGYLEEFQKPESVENAILVFGRAITQDTHYGLAYAGLGEAYWRKYEHTQDVTWIRKAREACAKGTELGNAGAAGNNCLGLIDDGTGKYQAAAEQFQKALTLEPANDASFEGLAGAYEGLGRLDAAEKTYQQAISLHSQCVACYNDLGWFYYRHARYADAIRLFSQVVKISPSSYIGYSNLGGAYIATGDYADAIPIFSHSIAIRPTFQAYSNLGTAYFSQGRFADAVDSNERALKLNDRYFAVWGNLGDAYYWTPGRRENAATAYQHAIALATQQYEVNPSNAVLLSDIAQYHAMLGEKKPALDCIGRALRLDPKNADVAFSAAIVYNQLGDVESTFVTLKNAMKGGVSAATVLSTPNFSNLESQPRFLELLKTTQSAAGGVLN